MEAQPTCGEGLAAHAALPRKLGQLTEAVAEVLELHRETLELDGESSMREDEAYEELARSHRWIAQELLGTAERMEECRNLPMGTHNEAALADSRHLAAFERLVQFEGELVELLQARLAEERLMLGEMRSGDVP